MSYNVVLGLIVVRYSFIVTYDLNGRKTIALYPSEPSYYSIPTSTARFSDILYRRLSTTYFRLYKRKINRAKGRN